MQLRKQVFLTIVFFLFSITTFAAPLNSGSPAGRWQSLFAGSGFPQFVMAIADHNGILTGTIVEVFAKPGRDPQILCTRCTGSRYNQPLLGMVILEHARYDSKTKTWTGGTFVDPATGRSYTATVWTSGQQALRIHASTSPNGNGLSHNYRWQRVG